MSGLGAFNEACTGFVPQSHGSIQFWLSALNVHLMELSCLLVGETSRLGVVLGERYGSGSPKRMVMD